ncbi:MAG: triose-phosphate isomerase [Actinomycetales bacterium]|nr:triose-phosphate isomerase [Actinomycetales bacterium]
MMARTPLMAGNWKMNLDHLEAIALVQKLAWALKDAKHDYSEVEVAVIPPFTSIRSVQTLVDGEKLELKYGAQDVSVHEKGAYTGEIAPRMLAKLGCTFAICGHSERRLYHAENDWVVGEKARAAIAHGITPIVCVGENLAIRREGRQVERVLIQVDGIFNTSTPEQARATVIAYEPIWAIGTGEVATPADAQEVCGAIRGRLAELYDQDVADSIRILYGGSVKASNVAAIMSEPDVDGALVGGASLDPEEFSAIVRYQQHLSA